MYAGPLEPLKTVTDKEDKVEFSHFVFGSIHHGEGEGSF